MRGVVKRRAQGRSFVLQVPELTITPGERVALVGVSGCGKSTLLDLLALVICPDRATEFRFQPPPGPGLDVAAAWAAGDQDRLARARGASLGYVLQTGGLLPFLSVHDNIALTRRLLGLPRQGRVQALAAQLGLAGHLGKRPDQLSVGERQRVAIARAMAHQPAVVLADEPTASLDPLHARQILQLFGDLVAQTGVTLVLATHDWPAVKDAGFRVLSFRLTEDPTGKAVVAQVKG
ncbi:MAG: ATP-binding cassette domain-containing protein [Deltaproteobacteria bacterium]|nr:ATP-binding cassette domain-containing protein [Deltaproteobacteria bacterium]